jgi:hypothetical protein
MDTTIVTPKTLDGKATHKVDYEQITITLCDLCGGYAARVGCACVRCMGSGLVTRRVASGPSAAVTPAYDPMRELQEDFEAIALDEWARLTDAQREQADDEAEIAWLAAEDEARRSWKVA